MSAGPKNISGKEQSPFQQEEYAELLSHHWHAHAAYWTRGRKQELHTRLVDVDESKGFQYNVGQWDCQLVGEQRSVFDYTHHTTVALVSDVGV